MFASRRATLLAMLAVVTVALFGVSTGASGQFGDPYFGDPCKDNSEGDCSAFINQCSGCPDAEFEPSGEGGSCPIDVACFGCEYELECEMTGGGVECDWVCRETFCGVAFCTPEP